MNNTYCVFHLNISRAWLRICQRDAFYNLLNCLLFLLKIVTAWYLLWTDKFKEKTLQYKQISRCLTEAYAIFHLKIKNWENIFTPFFFMAIKYNFWKCFSGHSACLRFSWFRCVHKNFEPISLTVFFVVF